MDTKTILVINLSILFVLLNSFEIVSSQDTDPIDEATLRECEQKMGDACGDMLLMHIFVQKTSVSKECCSKLINSGRNCHNILTESILRAKQFEHRRPKIMENHNEVWLKCEKDGQIA